MIWWESEVRMLFSEARVARAKLSRSGLIMPVLLLTGSIALITAATLQEAPAPPNPSVPQSAPQRQAPPGAPSGSPGGRRGEFGVQPLAETGFQPIFDGKSLAGWDCDPDYWRVENGEIVGGTRIDH